MQEGGESGSAWTREQDLNAAQVEDQMEFSCVSRVGIHRGAVRARSGRSSLLWTVCFVLVDQSLSDCV